MEIPNCQSRKQKRGRPRKGSERHEMKATANYRSALPAGTDRLLRIDAVCELVSMSRAWCYDAIKKGNFPPGVKISQRARGWSAASIANWIEQRQAA